MDSELKTEEKIKEAARTLFLKRGFAATKTRDIAEEAGINLALLNYYFRSKEKLFHEIMIESLGAFFQDIRHVFMDEQSTLDEKLASVAEMYIDQVLARPDIPMFILNEIRSQPETFVKEMAMDVKIYETVIIRQLIERIGTERLRQINPMHIMMNLISMTLFPFVGRPMLQTIGDMSDDDFTELMQERKQLIPIWINQMLN